jgi:hypothetical protein
MLQEERAIVSRLATLLMAKEAGLRPTTIEDELSETNEIAQSQSAKK